MNSSNISETLDPEVIAVATYVVPVFFGLITITGLFGNTLVILGVVTNSQMRSTTNLLIVNLAVADLLFVIFCIPFTATDYVLSVWPFGVTWCKIVQYLIVVTCHASIYTLVLMSVDRFLAVVHPVRSRSIRTEQYTRIALCILWSIILLASVPVAFLHGENNFFVDENHWINCQYLDNSFLSQATFQIVFFCTSYLIPLVLISVLYLCMLVRLWHRGVNSVKSAVSYKGKRKVTRMVVIVVVAFASLWFPIQVILVLKAVKKFNSDTTTTILLQIFSQTLAYTSSCINPLLYAFLSDNFRKAFRKAVYCSSKYRNFSQHTQIIIRESRAENHSTSTAI